MEGALGLRPHGVSYNDGAEQPPLLCDENFGACIGIRMEWGRNVNRIVRHPSLVADENIGATEFGRDATPGRVGEGGGLADSPPPLSGVSNNGLAKRVFGTQFGRGSSIQNVVGAYSASGDDAVHFRTTEGQRARLVEDHGVDPTQSLQMHAALNDGTKPRRAADAAKNGEGCASGDAAGTGHDDDRDGRIYIAGDEEGQHGGPEREIDEIAGHPVGQALHRGAGFLGPFYRLDDLAVAAIATDPLGCDL